MPKFYVKIDEGIEGPYESHLLRYLPGFNEETLVSSDDLRSSDWQKASVIPEIRPHLRFSNETLPPSAFSQRPPASPPAVKMSPLPAEPPVLEKTVEWGSLAANASPPPAAPEVPPAPPAVPAPTDQELLDVINQFSGQLKSPEPPVTKPAPAAPDVLSMVPPVQEKFIPKRAKAKRWLPWAAGAFVLILAALGFMAFKLGMLERWRGLFGPLLGLEAPAPVVEVPPLAPIEPTPPPVETAPPVEEPPKPLPPKKKPEAKKPSKPVKKAAKPAPKKAAPVRPPPEAKEEPLQMQKYVLPGVPAPKVQEDKKKEKPAEEAPAAVESKPPSDEDVDFAKEKKKAIKEEKKRKKEQEEDYFEFQWIGADPGEKK